MDLGTNGLPRLACFGSLLLCATGCGKAKAPDEDITVRDAATTNDAPASGDDAGAAAADAAPAAYVEKVLTLALTLSLPSRPDGGAGASDGGVAATPTTLVIT